MTLNSFAGQIAHEGAMEGKTILTKFFRYLKDMYLELGRDTCARLIEFNCINDPTP